MWVCCGAALGVCMYTVACARVHVYGCVCACARVCVWLPQISAFEEVCSRVVRCKLPLRSIITGGACAVLNVPVLNVPVLNVPVLHVLPVRAHAVRGVARCEVIRGHNR